MEVLKNKQQSGRFSLKTSTSSLVKQIIQEDGFRGLFRGYWLCLGVFVPYTVLWSI